MSSSAPETINLWEKEIVTYPNEKQTLQAWKRWLIPRRIFYIVIFCLLLLSILLMIVAASLTSCAQVNLNNSIVPNSFQFTAPYIISPCVLYQGSLLFSQTFLYTALFSDDFYLTQFTSQDILWQANANQGGSLMIIPPSTSFNQNGHPLLGELHLNNDGELTIVDGMGTLRWTNQIHIPIQNSNSNPWVLLVTSNGGIQIQSLLDASIGNYSNYIWRVDAKTNVSPQIPIYKELEGPFLFGSCRNFLLTSANNNYFGLFSKQGQFQIFKTTHLDMLHYLDKEVKEKPIWQTTSNKWNVPSSSSFSFELTITGNLWIVDDLQRTVWSSQSASYSQEDFSNYWIRIHDETGELELFSYSKEDKKKNSIQIWTSYSTQTPSSIHSPTLPLTRLTLMSRDHSLLLQFNSEDKNDPLLFTNGDLLLTLCSTNQTVSLSETAGRGKYIKFLENGNFIIQAIDNQIVFQKDTSNLNFPLPLTYTLLPQFQQFAAFSSKRLVYLFQDKEAQEKEEKEFRIPRREDIPLWALPLFIPKHVPLSLQCQETPIYPIESSLTFPHLFYLLQDRSENFVLELDSKFGILSIKKKNTGQIIKNQTFSFLPSCNLHVYFLPNGLFLLRNTDINLTNPLGLGQSSWDSRSGEVEFNSQSYVSFVDSETGEWVIQKLSTPFSSEQIKWSAAATDLSYQNLSFAPLSTSYTSPFLIHPITRTFPLQSSFSLTSPNHKYELLFSSETQGNLILNNKEEKTCIPLTRFPLINFSMLTCTTDGTLQIQSEENLRSSILLQKTNSFDTPEQLPVTLYLTDEGKLILKNFQQEIVWTVNLLSSSDLLFFSE